MNAFEFKDYKKLVLKKVQAMPKKGRGQWLKIARFLDVHTTMISQVFRGPLNLSLEQAQKLCEYFGFSELETEFFMNLVQAERAGTQKLKAYFHKQADKQRQSALNLSERFKVDRNLDEKSQAQFYSNWFYSGVRLLTAIPEFQTREAVAERLGLTQAKVNRVIEFLLSTGLCKEEDGALGVGESRTYVSRDSLLVSRHHSNWRMKVLAQAESLSEEELMYTSPVALSVEDFARIREEIVTLIERCRKRFDESPSEELACLNIDWVKIR